MWSSPPTTGSWPTPRGAFTFTAIDSNRGVLFGGYNPEHGRMNDVHIINVQTMVCLRVVDACLNIHFTNYDCGCHDICMCVRCV